MAVIEMQQETREKKKDVKNCAGNNLGVQIKRERTGEKLKQSA